VVNDVVVSVEARFGSIYDPLSHDQRAAAGSGAAESWIGIGCVQSRHDRNVTVTVTSKGLHPRSQKVGEEKRRSAPESTVSQTGSDTGWSAKAASAAPPSNNAATMIARIMIEPSVAPQPGSN
jgi:hypothetical protein